VLDTDTSGTEWNRKHDFPLMIEVPVDMSQNMVKLDGCLVEHLCRPQILCQKNKKINKIQKSLANRTLT